MEASKNSFKYSITSGMGIGGVFFALLAAYSLAYWFGSKCILQEDNCHPDVAGQTYTTGNVLTIFYSIVMAGFNFSQLSPALKKITTGKEASRRIFSIIDRQPLISSPPDGRKLSNLVGKIKFENVTFSYPKDPKRTVLDRITMEFDINKTGLIG